MTVKQIIVIAMMVLVPGLGYSNESSISDVKRGITAGGYVYQQEFMPKQTLEIDLERTAIFITDPQNDFLSEGGGAVQKETVSGYERVQATRRETVNGSIPRGNF